MPTKSPHHRRTWLIPCAAVALTAAAGYVDVVGYIRFLHVFSANMSGNHVRLGMALLDRNWPEVLVRGLPIFLFAAGAAVSEMWVRARGRHRRMGAIAGVWILEMLLLGVVVALGILKLSGWWSELISLGLLSAAMGLQNTSLRRAGALSVYTTHVTGSLTSTSMRIVDLIESRTWRKRAPRKKQAGKPGSSLWRLGLPLYYLAGAYAGAAAQAVWNLNCLAFPVLLLLVLVAIAPTMARKTTAAPSP